MYTLQNAYFIRISYDIPHTMQRIALPTYFHIIQAIDNIDRNILGNQHGTVKIKSSLEKYKISPYFKKSENWPKFIRLAARKVQMLLDYCPRLCYTHNNIGLLFCAKSA